MQPRRYKSRMYSSAELHAGKPLTHLPHQRDDGLAHSNRDALQARRRGADTAQP